MANCPSSCAGSVTEILTEKLTLERAIFVRLSQVVQAFGGQPVVVFPELNGISCSDSESELLADILEQKQANFNMLQQVILAV